jgi:ADP-dependent phosphofructokinase/glucokinase
LDWDKTYLVVRISFAKDIKNKEDLKNRIYQELEKNYIRNEENLPKKIKDGPSLLENLIITIREKKGKQVVILVDKYDKPILDLIEDIKQAEEVRKELKAFYSILKNLDEYIRFVLIRRN